MAHILLGDSAAASELLNGRYKITKSLLGEGACGKVFLAIDHGDGGNHMKKVAIKILDMSGRCSEFQKECMREMEIGTIIPDHSNVCKTLDSFFVGDTFYIVMELIEGKSFDVYMRETKLTPKTMLIFLVILYQMALAIAHLHANGIVHRDIKPANFLVSQNPDGTIRVVLVDFGFSNNSDRVAQEAVGTPYFMSPQVAGWSGIDDKCDIWAFGVLILLILTREEVPSYLKDCKSSDQAKQFIHNLKVNPFPAKLAENKNAMVSLIANIARRCLEIDPSMRPSAAEIAESLSAFKAQ